MENKQNFGSRKKESGKNPPADSQHPQETNRGRSDTGHRHQSGAKNFSGQQPQAKKSPQSSISKNRPFHAYEDMPDHLKQYYEEVRTWEIRVRVEEQKLKKETAALRRRNSGLTEQVGDLQQQVRALEELFQNRGESLRADKQAEIDELSGSISQLQARIENLKSTETELTRKIRGVLDWLADIGRKSRSVEGMPGVDESEHSPPAREATDADTADLDSQVAELQRRLEEALGLQAFLRAKEEELADRERDIQARESALPSSGENASPHVDANDSDAAAESARNEELQREHAALQKQHAALQKQLEELQARCQRMSKAGEKYVDLLKQEEVRASELQAELQSRDAQIKRLRDSNAQANAQMGALQDQKDQARKALEVINQVQDKFREDGLRMASETRDEFLKAVMAPIYEGVVAAATEAAGRLAHMRLAMQESEARRQTASERIARELLRPVLSGRAAIQLRDFLEAEPRGRDRDGQLMQRLVEDLRPFPGTRAHGLLDEAQAKEIELAASEGDRFAVVGLLRGAQVSIPENFKDCYSVPVEVPSTGVYRVERPGWMVGRAVLLPAILEAVPVP